MDDKGLQRQTKTSFLIEMGVLKIFLRQHLATVVSSLAFFSYITRSNKDR